MRGEYSGLDGGLATSELEDFGEGGAEGGEGSALDDEGVGWADGVEGGDNLLDEVVELGDDGWDSAEADGVRVNAPAEVGREEAGPEATVGGEKGVEAGGVVPAGETEGVEFAGPLRCAPTPGAVSGRDKGCALRGQKVGKVMAGKAEGDAEMNVAVGFDGKEAGEVAEDEGVGGEDGHGETPVGG